MQLWLTSFILLFGAVELWQWVQQASLPTPVFWMGGALLAIASNYNKISMPLHLNEKVDEKAPESPLKSIAETQAHTHQPVSSAIPKKASVRPPVSFEIQKPFLPKD